MHAIKGERDSRRRKARSIRRSAGFVAFFFWVLGTVTLGRLVPLHPSGRQAVHHKIPGPAGGARARPCIRRTFIPAYSHSEASLEDFEAQPRRSSRRSWPGASPTIVAIITGVRDTASIALPGQPVRSPGASVLDLSFAVAFAGFIQDLLVSLAEGMLGATVVALDTGPGYSAATSTGLSGAKVSTSTARA